MGFEIAVFSPIELFINTRIDRVPLDVYRLIRRTIYCFRLVLAGFYPRDSDSLTCPNPILTMSLKDTLTLASYQPNIERVAKLERTND